MTTLALGILGTLALLAWYLYLVASGATYSGRKSAAVFLAGAVLLVGSSILTTMGLTAMMGGSL